ncbi:hypothetical protein QZH41_002891 [Actinostola sp. cb2023]|nr:hypothetical protein QZH41_002891 [Actinostola sp. cb2023]
MMLQRDTYITWYVAMDTYITWYVAMDTYITWYMLQRDTYITWYVAMDTYFTWYVAMDTYITWYVAMDTYFTWYVAMDTYFTWYVAMDTSITWYVAMDTYFTWYFAMDTSITWYAAMDTYITWYVAMDTYFTWYVAMDTYFTWYVAMDTYFTWYVATGHVQYMIVPIVVTSQEGSNVQTFALLDSGSQTSLVLEDFANKVGLDGVTSTLHLGTVNSRDEAVRSRKVSFKVSAVNKVEDSHEVVVEEAWTVPQLNIPEQKVTRDMLKDLPHLSDIPIPEIDSGAVTILLGANVLEAILQRDVRRGNVGQPVAVLTAFGWTLTGSIKSVVPPERLHVMHVHRVRNAEEQLLQCVEEWWRTVAFGTKYENETPRSVEDKKALEILENTVKHLGDRYEVGMLWRDQDVEFPDNRAMSEKRLKSTERRLKRDETLADKYCAIIDDYVNKGYAKKLSPKEASMPTSKQWFLPHHPVLNANKPGKVRIVMDAAAKHDGVSLNDKLLIGPDLLNNFVGVLLRFREERVGVSADIEAMFHQCSIIAQDQPALRFLWRNLELNRAPDVYQMQVMIFGAAASPCMANYVLRKTATDNCDDPSFDVDTIESVEKNFYMDDFLKSVQDEATAIRLCQEITSLLARGGFRLTKWVSSSREVLSQIPTEEKANPSIDLNFDDLPIERTLGLKWNTQTDSFRFSVNSHKSTDVTKRSVLSMVSTVFDPLGVLTPFLLPAKCLIQTLWQKGKGWDEPLDPDDERIWKAGRLVQIEEL